MDNLDLNVEPESTPPTPSPVLPPDPPSNNRTFYIVAGVLGAIALVALICIVVIVMVWLPQKRGRDAMLAATVNAQNTQVAMIITQTSNAEIAAAQATAEPTSTPIPETPTLLPTRTSVVVLLAPTKEFATQDPRTPTVAALLTQAAMTTQTVFPTATALPQTGFAEDVGLPSLLGLAVLLIAVIFLARRLRLA
jgi:LPXTG-motif cell wall-anchored protein